MKYLLILSLILFTGCNNSTIPAEENLTEQPIIKENLTLNISKTSLNKNESTNIEVIDKNHQVISNGLEWNIVPKKATIKNGLLTANDNGEISIQAIKKGYSSNIVKINVTWIVDGVTLPEEPDKTINNSTLVGIDSNKNGVRDDVERWIYKVYKTEHPVHIDIAMQEAKIYQYLLINPKMSYEEVIATKPFFDAVIHCQFFYEYKSNEKIYNNPRGLVSTYFNTKERNLVYLRRDTLLSGGVYSTKDLDKLEEDCDFNTSKYKKERE